VSTWIKLHDNLWENPKIIAAGEDAALLYVQGLSYCSRNLTDGRILTAALRNLTAKKEARTLARVLVREGLWIETASGWEVHDYLLHQRSREQVEREREKARIRAAASRGVRANSGRTSAARTGTVRVPETETETDNPTPTPPPLSVVTCGLCGHDPEDHRGSDAGPMTICPPRTGNNWGKVIDPCQVEALRRARDETFGLPDRTAASPSTPVSPIDTPQTEGKGATT
jgi:hypothetical protein